MSIVHRIVRNKAAEKAKHAHNQQQAQQEQEISSAQGSVVSVSHQFSAIIPRFLMETAILLFCPQISQYIGIVPSEARKHCCCVVVKRHYWITNHRFFAGDNSCRQCAGHDSCPLPHHRAARDQHRQLQH